MKKVFRNSSEVIHIFAQRSQSEGRCCNVFFEDNRIYSYGRHYLLGEFIKNSAGEDAIMINNEGYSSTTSKHICELRAGTSHFKQFFTMSTDPRKVTNKLEELAFNLSKARKPEIYINGAESLFSKFQEFQTWNGPSNDIENLFKINELIKVFRGESYKVYLENKEARIKEAEKLRMKHARKLFKKDLKNFFDYKTSYIYNNPTNEDFCRVSQDGEFIETSQRVRVPIREARVLYQRIKDKKDIKGFNIGGFTVIGLNGVLKIGCHKINAKNMHEIGQAIL